MDLTFIPIPQDLTNYIEKLDYEERRYKLLLDLVDKNSMTEQEWLSSLEYFSILYEEAKFLKHFALQEILKIYLDKKEEINEWCIDFIDSQLILGTSLLKKAKTKSEAYNEYLNRLYPSNNNEKLHINDNSVKSVTLQVTQSCNMNCSYCYQHNKKNNTMSLDTAKKIINMLLDADEKTNSYITSTKIKGMTLEFIGGEPLLEINLIDNISQYFINEIFRRKHPLAITFLFGICSNGLLHFNPEVQKYLNKYKGLLSYGVSIDGDKELHDSCRVDHLNQGTYDRAMAAVYDYRNKNGYMGSKMTLCPENIDKTFESLKSMILNDYKDINLNCVYEKGWEKKHATTLYWQLHNLIDWLFENNLQDAIKLSIFSLQCGLPEDESMNNNWCGGTGLMLAFDYKGNAYPCLRYIETSSNPNLDLFIIGDLESGINNNKEHQNRVDCLACITRRSQSTNECFNCPISMGCGWCSAYNYEEFGTPNKRATYICDMHKARSLINFYYWRKKGIPFPLNCPKNWAIEIIGEKEFNNLQKMESD